MEIRRILCGLIGLQSLLGFIFLIKIPTQNFFVWEFLCAKIMSAAFDGIK